MITDAAQSTNKGTSNTNLLSPALSQCHYYHVSLLKAYIYIYLLYLAATHNTLHFAISVLLIVVPELDGVAHCPVDTLHCRGGI
jgi:hypothetical protein